MAWHRLISLALATGLVAAFSSLAPTPAAAAILVTEVPAYNNWQAIGDGPLVSGDRVVWQGYDGTDSEIFTWRAGDAEPTRITYDSLTEGEIVISGDRVAWEIWNGSDYDILTWQDGDVAPTQLTYDSTWTYDIDPDVSGNRVVWAANYEIFTWKAGDAAPTQLTDGSGGASEPRVSGDRVVWQGYDGEDYEIFTWRAGDAGPTRLTDNALADCYPQVSGDRVAWMTRRLPADECNLYTCMVGDPTPTLLAENVPQQPESLRVSGDRVVWRSVDAEVFTWRSGDAEPTQLSTGGGAGPAEVSGDRVVWQAYDGTDWDIFTWKAGDAVPTRVTDDYSSYELGPAVSGDRIVWGRPLNEIGLYEIFTAVLTSPEQAVVEVGVGTSASVGDVQIAFGSILESGLVTVSKVSTVSPLPSGFQLAGLGLGYDISTSARYIGPVALAMSYVDAGMTPEAEAGLKLFHFEDGAWQDVTTSVDSVNNVVTGVCDGLSPFAVCVPVPTVSTSPAQVNFGDVELGASTTAIVTVTNSGARSTPMVVSLDPASGVSIVNPPASWPTIAPGASTDIMLSFAPAATGAMGTTLRVGTQDPDHPTLLVPITGNGVRTELPPREEVRAILAYFDASVAEGTLYGIGPGKSANGRQGALRNMIEAADDLISRGEFSKAGQQLREADAKCDGVSLPPDFVAGSAVAGLEDRLSRLAARLGAME